MLIRSQTPADVLLAIGGCVPETTRLGQEMVEAQRNDWRLMGFPALSTRLQPPLWRVAHLAFRLLHLRSPTQSSAFKISWFLLYYTSLLSLQSQNLTSSSLHRGSSVAAVLFQPTLGSSQCHSFAENWPSIPSLYAVLATTTDHRKRIAFSSGARSCFYS